MFSFVTCQCRFSYMEGGVLASFENGPTPHPRIALLCMLGCGVRTCCGGRTSSHAALTRDMVGAHYSLQEIESGSNDHQLFFK